MKERIDITCGTRVRFTHGETLVDLTFANDGIEIRNCGLVLGPISIEPVVSNVIIVRFPTK